MPQIQNALEKFVQFVFKALEATSVLGNRLFDILSRVYDFFVQLDKATDGWSTIILGVIAAWKLLNLSFFATPLGLLITGFTALLALWDDFKTFKEGGQALINWGSETTKVIVGVTAAVLGLSAAIGTIAGVYTIWTNATKLAAVAQGALNLALALNPIGLVILAVTALIAGITALDAKFHLFGGTVVGFFANIGNKILDFASGPNVQANLGNTPGGVPRPVQPLGSGVSNNSQSNQNVQQQTNITVQGSADAQAVGKAVTGQQDRVNFDLARNLKGAMRQ